MDPENPLLEDVLLERAGSSLTATGWSPDV